MPTDGTIKNSGLKSTVLTVVLADRQEFRSKNDGTSLKHYVGPVFEGLGPNVADIVMHANLLSKSDDAEYKITLDWSYDGVDWAATPAVLIDATTSEGYVIGTAYSTRTSFGLFTRFIISITKGAGGSGQQNCVLSVTAAIRYHS